MWIPYDQKGPLKAETAPETISASRADQRLRRIMVGFFLRNPVTWTWEIDLRAGSFAESIETAIDGQAAQIALHGDDAGRIEEVIYRTHGTDALSVLSDCHRDIEARLSHWSLVLGRGMALAGWRVADPDHGARWRCTPFRPSALDLAPERARPSAPEMAALLRLYRQARNSSDPVWRLICATAILIAWRDGLEPLQDRRGPEQRVTLEMLVHSGTHDRLREMLNRPLRDLVDILAVERDALLAGLADPGRIAPCDLAEQTWLAQLANIADLSARQVLLARMDAPDAADPHEQAMAPAG